MVDRMDITLPKNVSDVVFAKSGKDLHVLYTQFCKSFISRSKKIGPKILPLDKPLATSVTFD